jgi:hypothetical protein
MMTRHTRFLAPMLLALVLLQAKASAAAAATPAGADTMLATYEGGGVTRTEFAQVWMGLVPSEYPPGNPVESRQAYLSSIVDRKLLEREAAKRPVALTPEETAEIDRQRELMVQNGLFAELMKDLPPPTEEELDLLNRRLTKLAEIRIVTFSSPERAHAWRTRLISGTPTSALDQAIQREGAALAEADSFRFVGADQIPDTLAQVIWTLRPGQVSTVHQFGGKPILIQLRKYGPRPDATAGPRDDLQAEFERRRASRIRQRFRESLITNTGRKFDDEGMSILLKAHLLVRRRNDVDSTTGIPIVSPNLALPQVAPADTGKVVARASGRAFTIGDYLAFWGHVRPMDRPEVRDRETLEGVVDRIALSPEMTRLGREHGVESDPKLQAYLQRLRDGFALDHYYRDQIMSKVKVDDEGLRKLFAAQPGHYDDRASITSHIIVVDRRSLADSLMTRLKQGASFSELARTYSMDGESAAKGGDIGTQFRGGQSNVGLEDAMYATPVGQVGGPEQTPQGWVLWRIDAKTAGLRRTFEQARDMLERDYKTLEAERILQSKLAELRKEAKVKLYPERVTADLGAHGQWGD